MKMIELTEEEIKLLINILKKEYFKNKEEEILEVIETIVKQSEV